MRAVWLICGLMSFGLGLLGVILPLLPTTPFMLLSAFCFARSSQRLHDWLVDHRIFGPAIRNWNRDRAIARPAKRAASYACAAAFGISVALDVPPWALGTQALALIGVMAFIWSRPEPG